jgi:3,4-dihydroxy 2-butanone 4-phosphate synthase/GTP cyclohydrolase II
MMEHEHNCLEERVEAAIGDIRGGRVVVLVDDEDRENEGDLCLAAVKATPEAINFMARHGRGLICVTLTEERVRQLGLPMMVSDNRAPMGTAFTVSVEARRGVTTGISAADRATTILAAVRPDARPEDLVSPGHVFPLRARRGGVLVRTGQTEGSVDLARLAGLEPAGVICEIMNDDGSMARMPDLERFAAEHGLRIVTIADLIEYRLRRESLVEKILETPLPSDIPGLADDFTATVWRTPVEETEYLALVHGRLGPEPTLVRVQTACLPGDVFRSRACDCGAQLRRATDRIREEGRGVVLYIFPTARASLAADFRSHVLHRLSAGPAGSDRHAPLRDFGLGAQVLSRLGLRQVRLLTNNPKKIVGLSAHGLEVVERVPIEIPPTPASMDYLRAKRDELGHLLADETLGKAG